LNIPIEIFFGCAALWLFAGLLLHYAGPPKV
jgi:hypothetical protein